MCSATLDLTTNSDSTLTIIDVYFVLMFLVTIITGSAIVFSTLWYTRTNDVMCEQSFTLLHINVIFHQIRFQNGQFFKSVSFIAVGNIMYYAWVTEAAVKYTVAIGEGGLAVNMKYPMETINLIV